jgi:general secretion pathway protein E
VQTPSPPTSSRAAGLKPEGQQSPAIQAAAGFHQLSATPAAADFNLPYLLDVLQHAGAIDAPMRRAIEVQAPTQRARMLRNQAGQGGGRSVGPGDLIDPVEQVAALGLLRLGDQAALDEACLMAYVADATGLTYEIIDPLRLDMGLVVKTLSRPYALRHCILPLKQDAQCLQVAVANPFDSELLRSVESLVKKQVLPVLCSRSAIIKSITEIYGFRLSVESAAHDARGELFFDFEQLVNLRHVGSIEASDTHVVNAVDFLFSYALDQRASDIHIEPRREHTQVRLRIDGVLHDVHSIPRRVHAAFISRIKTLARLDIAERRRPQDGRIKTLRAGHSVEMRVSTLPVAFGEKVVLRIFDPTLLNQDLERLGLRHDDLQTYLSWIERPHGLVLVTGPTGSGKTTTLYASLKQLADQTVNITTLEDPIEMVTGRFNQVAMQPKIGIDFASALRTILRQDPDIIMVGEIRDAATAQMAVQAALTGHLVLSTLHTDTAAHALTRLLQLGVPEFSVQAALVGVMAQRLVRRVCPHCREVCASDPALWALLELNAAEQALCAQPSQGHGCAACRQTGYLGRLGIYELLQVDNTAWPNRAQEPGMYLGSQPGTQPGTQLSFQPPSLLPRQAPPTAPPAPPQRSLRQCALEAVAAGDTSLQEVIRVLGRGFRPTNSPSALS